MLYIVCPTCKEKMGNIQPIYEKILDIICRDEEAEKISKEEANNLKSTLVRSFGLKYCSNCRLMSYKRIVEIVK